MELCAAITPVSIVLETHGVYIHWSAEFESVKRLKYIELE